MISDNKKIIEDFFNYPDSLCSSLVIKFKMIPELCTDTILNNLKDITKDGYYILSDKIELTFLEPKYQCEVIKIHINKINKDVAFGFNNQGQIIFIFDKLDVNTVELKNNYQIINKLINSPDSIKFYDKNSNKVSQKYYSYISNIIKQSFSNGFDIICDLWFYVGHDNNNTHSIKLQSKTDNTIINFSFIYENSHWILYEVNKVEHYVFEFILVHSAVC